MKTDFCPGIELPILQHPTMFHFNTDSVLLGQFLRVNAKETLLDIGTNNGVLLLYASVMKPKWMYGIDIQSEAIEYAQKNMELNGLNHVSLEVCSHTDYQQKVNVIVCNPPYFNEGFQNESPSLKTARHQITFTMESLFTSVARLLDDRGRFYLVYPSEQIETLALLASRHDLAIKRLQYVYKQSKQRSHVVLVECHKRGKVGCVVEAPIMVK